MQTLPRAINSYNLGRIVPAPNSGSDTSPTYFPPRMFIANAGAAGLAANAADKPNVAARSIQSNTSSPNPTSIVGSAGTAGLDGQQTANVLKTFMPRRAITGPGGAPVAPTVERKPSWLKPALFVAAGFAVGWMIFK